MRSIRLCLAVTEPAAKGGVDLSAWEPQRGFPMKNGGLTGKNGGVTGKNGGLTGKNGGLTGKNGGVTGKWWFNRQKWWFNQQKWWCNREKWWFNRQKWWFNWQKWWFNREKWWFNHGNAGKMGYTVHICTWIYTFHHEKWGNYDVQQSYQTRWPRRMGSLFWHVLACPAISCLPFLLFLHEISSPKIPSTLVLRRTF